MFAVGRNVYSLSRAGQYPKWLSMTTAGKRTLLFALVEGSVVGFSLVVFLPIILSREGVTNL
jgi:ethanolamine permease